MKRLSARELARRLRRSNTARQFGFVLESAVPRRVRLRMCVLRQHKQVHGVVHGGILAALADTAGGLVTYTTVPAGVRVATIEMKMNLLEPVEQGSLVAKARVLRCGRNFSVVDCDVTDSSRRLVATALMTFAYGMPEAAAGSRLARISIRSLPLRFLKRRKSLTGRSCRPLNSLPPLCTRT